MLVHCVVVRFKPDVTPNQVAQLGAAIAALPGHVQGIRRAVHGADVGERVTNADYALVLEFDDVDAFLAYRDHPAHEALVQDHVRPLAASTAATQFLVGD